MPTTIGEVNINLRMSLAQFKGDVSDGTQAASRATKEMAANVKGDVTEARGTLMLLGEDIGVTLPRHLQTAIAQLPGFATALQSAFGAVAVLALIDVIIKVIEKFDAIEQKAKDLQNAITTSIEAGEREFRQLAEETLNLEAEIEDLNGNHLQALKDRLTALDASTLDKLGAQMEALKNRADGILDKLKLSRFWAFLGEGDNPAVEKAKNDIQDITNQINDLKNAGGDGANAAIGKLIDDKIKELHSQDVDFVNDDPAKIKALQQEDQYLQQLLKDYNQLNAIKAAKTTTETAKTTATVETDKDTGLATDKQIGDAKAKLLQDQFAEQLAITRDGRARLRAENETDITEETNSQLAASETEYTNEVAYWQKIIANHTQNTEADKKIRDNANKQLELLQVKHQDQLVVIATEGANKLGELQKANIEKADALARQDIAHSEQVAKDKLAADDEYYSGAEEHLKAQAQNHQITLQAELAGELDLNQKRYDAEIEYLNTKVNDDAQILVIEANKNGQILSMDQALIQTRANLDSDFLKARQKLDNEDTKAHDEYAKELQQTYSQIANAFEDQLNTMLTTGKANWSSFFQSIETDMLKLIEKNLFGQLLGGLTGGGSFLSSLFGGGGSSNAPSGLGLDVLAFAKGTDSAPGGPAWVGEDGPELLNLPRGSSVTPMSGTKGGGTNKTTINNNEFHFHGVTDMDSFKKSKSQIAASLANMLALHQRRSG